MADGQPLELTQARDAVLTDMQVAVTELRAVLDAEREALDRLDSIALDAATSAKARLLKRLESLDVERRQLGDLAHGQTPSAIWQQICCQLDTCRRINQTNGSIVARQLARVRRALGILGGSGEGPPLLYGPGGHTRASAAPRPLSRA